MTTSLRAFWGPAAAGVLSVVALAGCAAPGLPEAAGYGISPSPQAQDPAVPAGAGGQGRQEIVLPPHVSLQADGSLPAGVLPDMAPPSGNASDAVTIRVPGNGAGTSASGNGLRQTGPVLRGPLQAGTMAPDSAPDADGSVDIGQNQHPNGGSLQAGQAPARRGSAQSGSTRPGTAPSGSDPAGELQAGGSPSGSVPSGSAAPGAGQQPAPAQPGPVAQDPVAADPAVPDPVPQEPAPAPPGPEVPADPPAVPVQPASPPDACGLVAADVLAVQLGAQAAALQPGAPVPATAGAGNQASGCSYAFGGSGTSLAITAARFSDPAAFSDRVAVEMAPLLARIAGIGEETVFETIIVPETGYRSYELTVRRGQDLYQFRLDEPDAPLYTPEEAQAALAAAALAAGL